jgi:two-component system, cell cycle response regulator
VTGAVVATSDRVDSATAAAAAVARAGPSAELDGRLVEAVSPAAGRPFGVVLTEMEPSEADFIGGVLAALTLVGAVTLVLGPALSRQLTRPIAEITAAAERVAAGDLDTTLPVGPPDEVGRLAFAFNHMTHELRRSVRALSRSRDALQDSLARLGGALGSTHDLGGLLQVVLDTAASTVGARGGTAYASEGRGPLLLMATYGTPAQGPPAQRIEPDRSTGVLRQALATGKPARDGRQVAVPLRRGDRPVGLLLLEVDTDPEAGWPLDSDNALRALIGPAAIAVDNVLLHQEAQRLSITDPLTGLWNFRYLSMSLGREIERAQRFDRPLAVLMLDLDHFKDVNDTYGHGRGDEVLREFAGRLSEQIREVDTLARYGGEEFVLVLPETTLRGAVNLAGRICAAVRRAPFTDSDGPPVPVTVSVGVAAFPRHGASPATLMRAADEALYVAKNTGRDRWATADGFPEVTGAPADG